LDVAVLPWDLDCPLRWLASVLLPWAMPDASLRELPPESCWTVDRPLPLEVVN
jgi:hypothetical protein